MTDVLPISTDRLIIRSFREDDAVAFHSWRNDEDVARFTLWDYPFSLARAEKFCREQAAMTPFPAGEYYQLMLEEKASGQAVGDIGIGNAVTPEGPGYVSIGYTLSPLAQGKGYMTEALRSLLPALVGPLSVTKFIAEIDARNLASGRVLERLGFKAGPVHTKRSFVKGEWCDEIDFVLDAADVTLRNKD